MNLVLNVKITDTNFGPPYNRYNLKSSSKLDIFKYMLYSLTPFNFSRIFINFDLDTNYEERRGELTTLIYELFPAAKVGKQVIKQYEWQELYQQLDDEPIMFFCNHDHIYLANNNDTFDSIFNEIKSNNDKPYNCLLSHWTEVVHDIACLNSHTMHDKFLIGTSRNVESIQLISKELFRSWWFDFDYGDTPFPRTDCQGYAVAVLNSTHLTPREELFRHFDGYSHISLGPEYSPPLEIPERFFDGDMVLDFVENKGNIYCNPLEKLKPAGGCADYHFLPEEIPLFWRGKIKELNIGEITEEHREAAKQVKINRLHDNKGGNKGHIPI